MGAVAVPRTPGGNRQLSANCLYLICFLIPDPVGGMRGRSSSPGKGISLDVVGLRPPTPRLQHFDISQMAQHLACRQRVQTGHLPQAGVVDLAVPPHFQKGPYIAVREVNVAKSSEPVRVAADRLAVTGYFLAFGPLEERLAVKVLAFVQAGEGGDVEGCGGHAPPSRMAIWPARATVNRA